MPCAYERRSGAPFNGLFDGLFDFLHAHERGLFLSGQRRKLGRPFGRRPFRMADLGGGPYWGGRRALDFDTNHER